MRERNFSGHYLFHNQAMTLNSNNCIHRLKVALFFFPNFGNDGRIYYFLSCAGVSRRKFTVGMWHLATGMSIHQKTSQSKI